MITIAIANHKGGVGKTTIAVNIAAGLSRFLPKKELLLVDLDPQANATAHFMNPQKLKKSIANLFDAEFYNQRDLIYPTRIPNLKIIPSNIKLGAKELIAASLLEPHRRIERYLKTMATDFSVIILDTPPSLGFFSMNALMATQYVLIPVNPEKLALDGLPDILKQITITQQVNPDLRVLAIIPTAVDRRYRVHKEILNDLRQHFIPLFREDWGINTNAPLKDASARRLTIYEYDSNCTAYRQFLSLSQNIVKTLNLNGDSNA